MCGCRGDNVAGNLYNIGDSSLGAEAYRLVAEKLSGAKSIYVVNRNTNSLNDTSVIAVRDGGAYYVYVVNKGTVAVSAQLSLALWTSVPNNTNTPVFVNRVKAASYGEVSEQLNMTNRAVTVVSEVFVETTGQQRLWHSCQPGHFLQRLSTQ